MLPIKKLKLVSHHTTALTFHFKASKKSVFVVTPTVWKKSWDIPSKLKGANNVKQSSLGKKYIFSNLISPTQLLKMVRGGFWGICLCFFFKSRQVFCYQTPKFFYHNSSLTVSTLFGRVLSSLGNLHEFLI